jgi:hypothetical protein
MIVAMVGREEADEGLRGTALQWPDRQRLRILTGTGGSTLQRRRFKEKERNAAGHDSADSAHSRGTEEGIGARSGAAATPSQNVDGGRRPLELGWEGWGAGCSGFVIWCEVCIY